ncbi:uncharacterized protein [Anabrus simplex]|uniref:uncharacterized protein isoform X2 n=1 Tax=Anabrus simplex TaxID=316456 RepID=UPI0035A34A29
MPRSRRIFLKRKGGPGRKKKIISDGADENKEMVHIPIVSLSEPSPSPPPSESPAMSSYSVQSSQEEMQNTELQNGWMRNEPDLYIMNIVEAFKESQAESQQTFKELNKTLRGIRTSLASIAKAQKDLARAKWMKVKLEIARIIASGIEVPFDIDKVFV